MRRAVLPLVLLALASCGADPAGPPPGETPTASPARAREPYPGETHLRNIRQLTSGGENAEAYFDRTGTKIVFQSTRDGRKADQIYTMNLDGGDVRMVSTGKGRTTCAYWFPDGSRILYASTHADEDEPAPPPDRSQGYVWRLFDTFEIYTCRPDGSDLRRLTTRPGYDAEATIAPDGSAIVFTALRDGDVDLYTMSPDGTDVRRITREPGYDGGAFFSEDGRKLVWRASRPRTDAEREDFRRLVETQLVRPVDLEVFVANRDGSDVVQVTSGGGANWAPFFHPDGSRIVFASNRGDRAEGRRGPPNFDLYLVRADGTGLERITTYEGFDGFPMFSPDGRKLVWCSNRHGSEPGETNVFVADWVD